MKCAICGSLNPIDGHNCVKCGIGLNIKVPRTRVDYLDPTLPIIDVSLPEEMWEDEVDESASVKVTNTQWTQYHLDLNPFNMTPYIY